jgi:hypothetical protein
MVSCPDFTTAVCYLCNAAPTLIIPKMNVTGTNVCAKTELALRVNMNFVMGKITMSLYFTKSLAVPMKLDKVYEGGLAP